MSLFKPLCKYCATITSIREIGPIMKEAIKIAQSGTPGEMCSSVDKREIVKFVLFV